MWAIDSIQDFREKNLFVHIFVKYYMNVCLSSSFLLQ